MRNETTLERRGGIQITRSRRSVPGAARIVALGLTVAVGGTWGPSTSMADVIYTATPGLTLHPENSPVGLLIGPSEHPILFYTVQDITSTVWEVYHPFPFEPALVIDEENHTFVGLPESVSVGPDQPFMEDFMSPTIAAKGSGGWNRDLPWQSGTDGYLGLRITTSLGCTHYGWIHLVQEGCCLNVIGYAYESLADTPICTGLSPDACAKGDDTLPTGCGVVDGDLNTDGLVDGADLGLLLNNWGGTGLGDLNADGVVDGADLGILLNNWS